jgi:PPK2 family polyphosphate:nucleotide phosphotransferase
MPANGLITIFNRSHYEDVLVVRVNNLVPEDVWQRRYDHITQFERMLTDEGTTIVKLFLHISEGEQRQRLQSRLDEPEKRWKFSVEDLETRKLWDRYMQAYEDALTRTSTAYAPWYVVPADRKWYRNLVVSSILIDTLQKMDPRFPPPSSELSGVTVV